MGKLIVIQAHDFTLETLRVEERNSDLYSIVF